MNDDLFQRGRAQSPLVQATGVTHIVLARPDPEVMHPFLTDFGLTDWVTRWRHTKWKAFLNIVEHQDGRWSFLARSARPKQGCRRPRRPNRRWRDEIEKFMSHTLGL